MDEITLGRILSDIPLGPVRYFDRIGSTNSEAVRWADAGAPDLALVVADEQTGGRGRSGRLWFTPPSAALAFSLALRFPQPPNPASWLPRLTALGALAVSDVLIDALTLPTEIKWPNDVLVRRRKVAGVLAEAAWQGDRLGAVILGIGVNIAPVSIPPPGTLIYPATCLETETGRSLDRWEMLHAILARLVQRRAQLESIVFFTDWQTRLAFLNEWVQVIEEGNSREGKLLGLSEDGSLHILGRDGQTSDIYTGDLRLRPLDNSPIS